jgi:hypothetical protein
MTFIRIRLFYFIFYIFLCCFLIDFLFLALLTYIYGDNIVNFIRFDNIVNFIRFDNIVNFIRFLICLLDYFLIFFFEMTKINKISKINLLKYRCF